MREVPTWLALMTDIVKLIVFIGALLFMCWILFHHNDTIHSTRRHMIIY
jgi:hypothetical protein